MQLEGLSNPLGLPKPAAILREIHQDVWLATGLGRGAAVSRDSGGVFSAAVLDSLDETTGLRWQPTLEHLSTLMREKARDYGYTASSPQQPTRLQFENDLGTCSDVDVGFAAPPPPKNALSGEILGMFGQLLGAPEPATIMHGLWAAAATAHIPMDQLTIREAEDLTGILERLNATPDLPGELPSILVFLEHLAGLCTGPKRNHLRAVIDSVAVGKEMQTKLAAERARAELQERGQAQMLVTLGPDFATTDAYRLSGCLYRPGIPLVIKQSDDFLTKLDSVRNRAEEIITELSQFTIDLLDTEIVYEFLLDRDSLDLPVETWTLGDQDIGARSLVRLRSWDRLRSPRMIRVPPHLRRRWETLNASSDQLIGWICDELTDGPPGVTSFNRANVSLPKQLAGHSSLVYLILGWPYSTVDGPDLFDSVLSSGIPVVLWQRTNRVVADQTLARIASSEPGTLPSAVLASRKDGDPAGLALLWDPGDPFPERIDYIQAPPPIRSTP